MKIGTERVDEMGFRDKLTQRLLRFRYGNDAQSIGNRGGAKIGAGIALMMIAVALLYPLGKDLMKPVNYESISTTSEQTFQVLEQQKTSQEPLTIILYSSECEACAHVEKDLVRRVREIKDNSKQQIIATDLAEMNADELDHIRELLPEVLVDGDKIPTPTVANVQGVDGKLKVLEYSDKGNMKLINRILEKRR